MNPIPELQLESACIATVASENISIQLVKKPSVAWPASEITSQLKRHLLLQSRQPRRLRKTFLLDHEAFGRLAVYTGPGHLTRDISTLLVH